MRRAVALALLLVGVVATALIVPDSLAHATVAPTATPEGARASVHDVPADPDAGASAPFARPGNALGAPPGPRCWTRVAPVSPANRLDLGAALLSRPPPLPR